MNNREKYCAELTNEIKKIASNRKIIQKYSAWLYDKHNIPTEITIDVLTMREDVRTLTSEMLYYIGKLFEIKTKPPFTEEQMADFEKWKYKTKALPKYLEFEMVQITDDQWVGKITASELMEMRDARIINYNENTQRVMKRINKKGEEERYQISLNHKAIRSMEELFNSGVYVPNTITLNMPEDTDYTYRDGILKIKKIDHFDIIDGYHRYIAMSNCYNLNKDFDYPMELRIVSFSEARCLQQIWQEDQKTKMSRVDSESMNSNSASNKVVQRLNADPICNVNGMINNNGGIINAAELAEIIRVTYFIKAKVFSKKKELDAIMEATKQIRTGVNYVTEKNTELLDVHWERQFLYCLIYNIASGEAGDELYQNTLVMEKKCYDEKMFKGREVTNIDRKRLAEMKKGDR